ncbi:TlpA family protein disulfide reductase [Pelotomaculum isophthalicicum JI]|uniref:TlpA family protein disulfide reductase n=1 Tax=Pelotomaculum isophthalicicum JI TaxID=947010 RepID=A0A9X4H3Z3_9FIRM|nr:TlpA family protein disulfide reductase [Pelotomaculum isophthalicicum JI]
MKKKYAKQGLSVIGIIVDSRNTERARQVIAAKEVNYTNLLDDGRFSEKINAVPQTFIVDGNGLIVQSITGSRTLQQFSQIIDQCI